MNEIKDCIDALLAAIQNSEEYQEFVKYKEELEQDPELLERVNAFRGNNFRLQNRSKQRRAVPGNGTAQQRIKRAS